MFEMLSWTSWTLSIGRVLLSSGLLMPLIMLVNASISAFLMS